jgi:hypothetical protein
MIEAHVHLAYAPRGAGLLYAVLWFAQGRDVYGWYVGMRDGVDEAAYFMLPGHVGGGPALLYRSVEDDIFGPWLQVTPHGESALPHAPPVPQPLCHDLSRLQDEFVSNWLFFDTDPGTGAEAQALNTKGLPVRHVNIRPSRLGRLTSGPVVWRYDAPGADLNVLDMLARLWPLDERTVA